MRKRVYDFSLPGQAPCLFDSLREAQLQNEAELLRVQEDFGHYLPNNYVHPQIGGYVSYNSVEDAQLVRANGVAQTTLMQLNPEVVPGRIGSVCTLLHLRVSGTVTAEAGNAISLVNGFVPVYEHTRDRHVRMMVFAHRLPRKNVLFPDLKRCLVPAPVANQSWIAASGALNTLWAPYTLETYEEFMPLYDKVLHIPPPKQVVVQEQVIEDVNQTSVSWDSVIVPFEADIDLELPVRYEFDSVEGGSNKFYPDIGLYVHIQEYQRGQLDGGLPNLVAQGVVQAIYRK